MNILDIALKYRSMGLAVVPNKGKHPLVQWSEYQSKLPTGKEIRDWWKQYPDAGISAVVGTVSGVIVVDCDSQDAIDRFEKEIPDDIIIPTAETPRGGRHYYFSCTEAIPKCVGIDEKIDLQAEKSCIVLPPSRGSNGKNYRWIIEPHSKEDFPDIHVLARGLQCIYKKIINIYKEKITHCDTPLHTLLNVTGVTLNLGEGGRNDSLFHIANSLLKGGMDIKNVIYTLKNIGQSCTPPLTDKEINIIIDSANKRNFTQKRNIHQEVFDWVSVTSGYFSVTSCYMELQIVTKEQKAAVRQSLVRLVNEGILEKTGRQDGLYRLREPITEEIDFINADTTPFNVRWPLGIHDLVRIYRKSIIIVAGESNAGKTAFCLNVARLNRDTHNVQYYLSEGDAAELKIRLEKFPEPLNHWKKVRFRYIRGGNLAKMIDPEGFNIIDYLELYRDFYEVAGVINEIYEALTTGIAVIAVQKPEGRDLGVGGRGTLDKARLYLSIEPGKIKIVKGKIWKNEFVNPNGMCCFWKLGGGCHFAIQNCPSGIESEAWRK